MRRWHKAVILGMLCALIIGFYFTRTVIQPTRTSGIVVHQTELATVPAIDSARPANYFFDVHGHSAEEIIGLLNRAKDTYDELPPELQESARIVMVLHGPDVEFFAGENYARYKSLVDLAANVDALGFIDLKACAASVRSRSLQTDKFPPFIEFVPYGPGEVTRLRSAGYVQL